MFARPAHLRIAARLDVKAPNVVKGIRLEGLRVVGKPRELARKYYSERVDEIVYQDVVASLYGRNGILELVAETAGETYVPLTVGGGLRTANDVQSTLLHGADRVSMNTAALEDPDLINRVAQRFGSQCVSLNVEAQSSGRKSWECLTNCGRERTHRDVVEWVTEAVARGAGEVVLTSVERDGMRNGFDFELLASVVAAVPVPVMIHGGFGDVGHAVKAWDLGASGVVIASMFHYGVVNPSGLKRLLSEHGVPVRP
jgi:cyclase